MPISAKDPRWKRTAVKIAPEFEKALRALVEGGGKVTIQMPPTGSPQPGKIWWGEVHTPIGKQALSSWDLNQLCKKGLVQKEQKLVNRSREGDEWLIEYEARLDIPRRVRRVGHEGDSAAPRVVLLLARPDPDEPPARNLRPVGEALVGVRVLLLRQVVVRLLDALPLKRVGHTGTVAVGRSV